MFWIFEFEYKLKLKEKLELFSEGNAAGVKIHDADKTNIDARMLPCKVLESKTADDFMVLGVYNPPGNIRNSFRDEKLIDM